MMKKLSQTHPWKVQNRERVRDREKLWNCEIFIEIERKIIFLWCEKKICGKMKMGERKLFPTDFPSQQLNRNFPSSYLGKIMRILLVFWNQEKFKFPFHFIFTQKKNIFSFQSMFFSIFPFFHFTQQRNEKQREKEREK